MRSPAGRVAIEERATGNQLSMRNLSQAALSNIALPWPEDSEPQEIVRRIETAFAWLDRVASEHANASRLLPKLDQAILAKAFRGELVQPDGQPDSQSARGRANRAQHRSG
jgi:type I restriction enzyme S subunit